MAFPVGISRAWQRISKSLFQTSENTIEVYNGVKPQQLHIYGSKAAPNNYARTYIRNTTTTAEFGYENSDNAYTTATTFRFGPSATLAADASNYYVTLTSRYGVEWVTQSTGLALTRGLRFQTGGHDQFIRQGTRASVGGGNASTLGSQVWLVGASGYNVSQPNAQAFSVLCPPGFSQTTGNDNGGKAADFAVWLNYGGSGFGTGVAGANGRFTVVNDNTDAVVFSVDVNGDTIGRSAKFSGNLATGAVAKSADYTATTSDGTIEVDASGAARTITLFAASGNAGKIIVIKKTDSSGNAVTVDGNASETIDGATTISLASQYSTAILQVNAAGTGWNKLCGV